MRRNRDFIGPSGMGGMVSLWGASSLIKSVQRGTISVGASGSGTLTIAAVDTSRTILSYLFVSTGDTNANPSTAMATLTLTNSTTVTGTKLNLVSTTVVSVEVIELVPGVLKSLQQGTVIPGAVSSVTQAVTEVQSAKSALITGGITMDGATSDQAFSRAVLTNGTTITFTRGSATNNWRYSWQLAEFF